MVQDWTEVALVVARLEQGRVGSDIAEADELFQRVNGTYGAQRGALVVARQGYFLDTFAILNHLSFVQLQENAVNTLELDILDVTPAEEADRVHVLVRFRDKGRRSQHCEVVN